METLMKKLVARLSLVIMLAATVTSSLSAKQKGVAGSWTLSAEGYVMNMVLVQRGSSIKGTLRARMVRYL
jgi:hypothetical protein